MDVKCLPKRIIRMDDGMEFLLNEETQLYSVHLGIPRLDNADQIHTEYSFERLMCDPRSKGLFKIADGTEDIAAMKQRWKEEMDALTRQHRGCGGDDDD